MPCSRIAAAAALTSRLPQAPGEGAGLLPHPLPLPGPGETGRAPAAERAARVAGGGCRRCR
ncbi:predicted protein [Streptomyces pristinaespiralis ATCC 25486]|uniref:Predicted protein n=1 Tax=Streptomyces pristinaespiralis (strain ATCC 25486 / DSM 40338 / CBS 914.69 / JCM 4507 / KCC S-0507 / NBRC 13074 / NRRL 2958 / 5647) TaxID=457429 RepID=D6X694_STRE2|nr:predicted protein [Streptomyces pristinaespiralis ATCC 25486]